MSRAAKLSKAGRGLAILAIEGNSSIIITDILSNIYFLILVFVVFNYT